MSLNLDALRAINALSGNPFLDSFFIAVAIIGDFIIWTFSAAPFLFVERIYSICKRSAKITEHPTTLQGAQGARDVFKRWRKAAVLWIIASCAAGLLTLLLKAIFAVPRPYEIYGWVNLVGGPLNDSSFPSGHAMRAAATLAAAAPLLFKDTAMRRWRKYASLAGKTLAAALVSFGRIYLGVHYPSDVLAGIIIGVALGFGIWKISGKFEKKNYT